MKLEISVNLYPDWIKLVLKEISALKKLGFKFEEYDSWKTRKITEYQAQKQKIETDGGDSNLVLNLMEEASLKSQYESDQIHTYIDFEYRKISSVPREIKYAKNFHCPPAYEKALKKVEQEIRTGASLFPRLSRQIFDAGQQDGMLFDWGINHLHLGMIPDTKNPTLIKGTKEILYLIATETTAYLLAVADHGLWADEDLLRIVKDSFPELLEPFQIKLSFLAEPNVPEEQHLALRKNGMNITIERDGKYYSPLGGGINSARGSMRSTARIQQISYWYQCVEELLKEHLPKITVETERLKNLSDIELEMRELEPNRITLYDKKSSLQVVLTYTIDRTEVEYNILCKLNSVM